MTAQRPKKGKPAPSRGSKPGEIRGNAGKGRKPGSPNKATKELKDMILGALDGAGDEIDPKAKGGGQAYLQAQAIANPGPFLALIGKVLPSTINATLGNPDGSPLSITVNLKRPKE